MRFLLFLIFANISSAQSAQTILTALSLINNPPTLIVTVTASQGDGSSITLSKQAGASISLAVMTSGGSGYILTYAAMTDGYIVNVGDTVCILLANMGKTPLAATGSWTAIPVNSVGYQCSTNIRTSGSISGQTAIVNGSVTWP